MKCPKCGLDNPAKTRYCLRCGSILLPPVPKPSVPVPPAQKKGKSPIFWICSTIGLFFVLMIVGGIFFSLIAVIVADDSPETIITEVEPVNTPWVEVAAGTNRDFTEYLDESSGEVTVPDSHLSFTMPASWGYRFAYDEARRSAIIEAETQDETIVTVTITELTADPVSLSEIENNDSNGMYWAVEGDKDLYYYILNPNGRTASGTLVDTDHKVSVNIVVYDQQLSGFDREIYYDESYGYDSGAGNYPEEYEEEIDSEDMQEESSYKTVNQLLDIFESTGIQQRTKN